MRALGIHASRRQRQRDATRAPAKSSGVAVAAPVKSSSLRQTQTGGSEAGGCETQGRQAQRIRAIAVAGQRSRARGRGSRTIRQQPLPQLATAFREAEKARTRPSEQPVVPDSKYNANGRRDPFISPVVSHAGGSGCSTGKKCLEIGAINLRGVVHSKAASLPWSATV